MTFNHFIRLIETRTGHPVKKSGSGYSACCPAHEDKTPSLSFSESPDGKILVHCFSGCETEEICASLGMKITDLFPQRINGNQGNSSQINYDYLDEIGNTLFSKIRIEPGFDGKKKNFYWKRINESGEIVKNLTGCRKIIYRLPDVIRGICREEQIFLVEGEKDVDKLAEYGLIATTAPESLKWCEEYTKVLENADVVILYDMDKTGIERRGLLLQMLQGKVKRLRVIDLPGFEYQEAHGKDISDWFTEGNTTKHLLEIVSRTPDFMPLSHKEKIRAVTMRDFLNMELPKREMLLNPFLPSQGLCLLYAKRGVGKTHVALGIAYAVASGGNFLNWEVPCPKKVLYIDGEMPAIAMQERLKRISVTEDLEPPDPSFLRFITPDLQEGAMPNLSTKEGREELEELIQDSDLIIIDNISTLFRSGVENEAESWQSVQDWALELRRKGKSVLFIHHAAKGGQQRGTSKREDILDTVISLKHPEGYRSDQGAAFEVNFEKTRHFAGEDAASFRVELKEQEDGLWLWEIDDKRIVDSKVLAVAEAIKEGLTIEQIGLKTGLTKSQVETRKKKAKSEGLI
ncbi:MAG: AAA family ATPase [Candidatus Neptunochlamydia sp.]|nr:AAA family ATPase [Candidatus Neptunochlamydia sp.]